MGRTIITACLLLIGVWYLPASIQVLLFIIAILTIPHRLAVFIPAVVSDALYSGGEIIFLQSMTLVVAVLLLIHWLLRTHTRVGHALYGVETN